MSFVYKRLHKYCHFILRIVICDDDSSPAVCSDLDFRGLVILLSKVKI
jgi:hypothetical protein